MSYRVHDSKRGKVFETLQEARSYAADIARTTGDIVAVTECRARATHIYVGEGKK